MSAGEIADHIARFDEPTKSALERLRHISYLPRSGRVLATVSAEELGGFSVSKGAAKIPIGADVLECLVRTMIAARRSEAGSDHRAFLTPHLRVHPESGRQRRELSCS